MKEKERNEKGKAAGLNSIGGKIVSISVFTSTFVLLNTDLGRERSPF